MTQYIDKSALEAEIEKKTYMEQGFRNEYSEYGYHSCARDILFLLDTLEVKEVDLEKELKCYCNDYYNCDYPKQIEEENCSEVMPHIVSAAKHFFELGLKAQKGE